MKFTTPPATAAYNQASEGSFRDQLARFLNGVLRGDRDAEMQPETRLILSSPNGTRWAMSVSNAGATVWTAL